MKKFYATIFSMILACGGAWADGHSLSFVRDGQVLADGATITVSEVSTTDWGDDFYISEMTPQLSVRNNESYSVNTMMTCEGISGDYTKVSFCYGVCAQWGSSNFISCPSSIAISGKSDRPCLNDIHISEEAKTLNVNATIKLTLYPESDKNDAVTLTVVFNTNSEGIKGIKANQNVEVFNLCGKKISNTTEGLAKGVYIIKQGKVSRKVVIR